jgi:hypothetical protein
MLRRVTLLRTDVSEERIASMIRITLTMQAELLSETSVLTVATRRNITEDVILNFNIFADFLQV